MGCRPVRGRAAGKKGALLLGRLVDERTSVLRRLSYRRGDEVGFGRFLGNEKVTVEAIFAAEAAGLAERVAGLDVVAIQDTSELSFGRQSGGRRGAVDLAGLDVETLELERAEQLLDVPAQAVELDDPARGLGGRDGMLIADRESDIYEAWVRLPSEQCRLLARACRDRMLVGGGRLFEAAAAWPVAERIALELPAAPGRPARRAKLALRQGAVEIKRPKNCSDKQAPPQLRLWLVEALEEDPPPDREALHWRLLVSHPVTTAETARGIVELYRLRWHIEQLFRTLKLQGLDIEASQVDSPAPRWHIEQLFRTLKLQGLDIEASQVDSPAPLTKLVALATIAAARIMQLVAARDGGSRPAIDAIDPDLLPLVDRLQQKLEGQTAAQTNKHPRGSLAWLAWIIARLGGWKGYPSERPPGPITMHHGWIRFQHYAEAWRLLRDV